ncbi:electron transfer flavoprotein subunit alpha/FixB family protein [Candidatus Avelusimicrobium fimicolum]|uniref:electron transfer flavoprotein subunit alpha/FixB family protein n=1 Tax=Candidatus Avelusimicrobium fimicolum TaxID=3416216 RepID=UPI003D14FBA0
MKDFKNVWIFAEAQRGKLSPTALELLTAGRKLADDLGEKLCAVLLGYQVERFAKDLFEYGADVVYVCDDKALENYVDDIYAKTLAGMIEAYKPNKFLLPATNMGRSLSAKTAVFVGTGLTADATEVLINPADGQLHATRPTFGGNLMATITCAHTRPEMCSLRPMSYEKAALQAGRTGEVVKFPFDAAKYTSLAQFIKFIKSEGEGLDLSEAEVIVAGGRGVGKAEGFELLKKLADRLGGAVAASRAPVDSGWIDYRYQIGLTGRTVKPKLYIACGISGQIQHMAGMSGSDVIVAINKDGEAPMMKVANYAVQGDLYDIIPAMLEALK